MWQPDQANLFCNVALSSSLAIIDGKYFPEYIAKINAILIYRNT